MAVGDDGCGCGGGGGGGGGVRWQSLAPPLEEVRVKNLGLPTERRARPIAKGTYTHTHTRHEFVDSVNGMAVFCGARGASRGVRKSLEGLEEGLRKVPEAILPRRCSSMFVRVAPFFF